MTRIGVALITDGRCSHRNEMLTQVWTATEGLSPQLVPREYALSRYWRHGWRELRQLRTRLREEEIGVIHATSSGIPGITARWLSARTGLPLFASCYGGPATPLPRYDRWLLDKCSRVVVPSELVRASIVAAGSVPSERVVLARAGVDSSMFSPSNRSASLRSAWRVSDRRPAILCTGPLSPHALDLLARIRIILDEYRRPHRFIVAADAGDIEGWRDALPDAAFMDHLERADIQTVFASGDIFLTTGQASYPDPACLLLMAQASGLPVVAADIDAHKEAVCEGTSGHLCHRTSEQDFAWRTAELLANTPRRSAMAAGATAYARRRPWSAALAPLVQAYLDVSRPTLGAREAGAALPVGARAL